MFADFRPFFSFVSTVSRTRCCILAFLVQVAFFTKTSVLGMLVVTPCPFLRLHMLLFTTYDDIYSPFSFYTCLICAFSVIHVLEK